MAVSIGTGRDNALGVGWIQTEAESARIAAVLRGKAVVVVRRATDCLVLREVLHALSVVWEVISNQAFVARGTICCGVTVARVTTDLLIRKRNSR